MSDSTFNDKEVRSVDVPCIADKSDNVIGERLPSVLIPIVAPIPSGSSSNCDNISYAAGNDALKLLNVYTSDSEFEDANDVSMKGPEAEVYPELRGESGEEVCFPIESPENQGSADSDHHEKANECTTIAHQAMDVTSTSSPIGISHRETNPVVPLAHLSNSSECAAPVSESDEVCCEMSSESHLALEPSGPSHACPSGGMRASMERCASTTETVTYSSYSTDISVSGIESDHTRVVVIRPEPGPIENTKGSGVHPVLSDRPVDKVDLPYIYSKQRPKGNQVTFDEVTLNDISEHSVHQATEMSKVPPKDAQVISVPQIEQDAEVISVPMVKQDAEVRSAPVVQQGTEVVDVPMIQQDTEVVSVPVVQQDTEVISVPMVEQDTAVISVSVVQQDTEVVNVSLVQQDTEVVSVPVFQQDTEVVSVPVVQQDTEVVSVPMVEQDTEVISVPVVQHDTEVISVPMVEQDTAVISVSVVQQDTEVVSVPVVQQDIEVVGVPVVQQDTEVVSVPLVEQGAEIISVPMVQQDIEVISLPMVEQDTAVISVSVVQQDTEVVSVPVAQQDTEVVGVPVVQQDTEVVGVPVVQQDTEVVSVPLVEQDAEIISVPMVQQDTEAISVPVVQNDTEVRGEPLVQQDTISVSMITQDTGSINDTVGRYTASSNYTRSDTEDSDDLSSSSDGSDVELDDRDEDSEHVGPKHRFGPVTKGELTLLELPAIGHLQITVPEEQCTRIGVVASVVDTLVVVDSVPDTPALDLDSILFLQRGKHVLGRIFDVMGSVTQPSYCVRFNTADEIREFGIEAGVDVYYVPGSDTYTRFVFLQALRQVRGSDASWWDCNEPPDDHQDFSDDEAEKMWKKSRKRSFSCSSTSSSMIAESSVGSRRKVQPVLSSNIRSHWNSGASSSGLQRFPSNSFSVPSSAPYNTGVSRWGSPMFPRHTLPSFRPSVDPQQAAPCFPSNPFSYSPGRPRHPPHQPHPQFSQSRPHFSLPHPQFSQSRPHFSQPRPTQPFHLPPPGSPSAARIQHPMSAFSGISSPVSFCDLSSPPPSSVPPFIPQPCHRLPH